MRKFWAVLSLFAVLALPSISWSRTVSLVLKTGDVVKGKLLGSGEKGLIIQSATGKARTYPYSTVEEVFDADTNDNLSGEYLKKDAATPKTKKKVVKETVAAEDEAVEASTPAARTVKAKPTPLAPRAFKPGLSFGMELATGSRASNPQLTDLWTQWLKLNLGAMAEEPSYSKLPLTDLGIELLYKPHPCVGFGVFGQWYWLSLGTNQSYERSVFYGLVDQNATFDMSFGAVSYGGMLRLRPSAKSRVAFAFYGGRLSLAGAGASATSNDTKMVQQDFSGSAPYLRGDLEFSLVKDTTRAVPILFVGYQACKIDEVKCKLVTNYGVADGRTFTWKDINNQNVELDYSSLRLGLKVVGKF
jgi:hypothetical protein